MLEDRLVSDVALGKEGPGHDVPRQKLDSWLHVDPNHQRLHPMGWYLGECQGS